MGAFAPSPLVDAALEARVMREIVEPVLAGMAAEGHPFRGFLYVGLMLTADGPKVIEFNVRLGDPEAQVDPAAASTSRCCRCSVAAATGALRQSSVARFGADRSSASCSPRAAIRSRRNPASRFTASTQPSAMPGVAVFHAGTARRDGQLVTAGGRVLTVVGRGADFAEAIARAYARRRADLASTACSIGATSDESAQGRLTEAVTVKYSVITFGCRVNQADSLGFEEELRARGRDAVAPQTRRSRRRQHLLGDGDRGSGRAADDPAHRARQSRRAHRRHRLLRDAAARTKSPRLPNVVRVVLERRQAAADVARRQPRTRAAEQI